MVLSAPLGRVGCFMAAREGDGGHLLVRPPVRAARGWLTCPPCRRDTAGGRTRLHTLRIRVWDR